MKKLRNTIVTLSGLAAIATLAACGKKSSVNPTYTEQEVVAMESILAFNTIDMMSENTQKLSTNVDMEKINSIIAKGNVLAKNTIKIETSESDKEGFIEKKTLTYGDSEYIMYVKESFTETDDDEEDEIESETKYSGVLVDGDLEYDFFVKEEIEADDDEYETEFTMTVIVDDTTKVIIKEEYEIEDDEEEQTFQCKYTKNGNTVDAYKIKREKEDGKYKIKIQTPSEVYKLKYYSKKSSNYLDVELDDYTVIMLVETTVDDFGNIKTSYNYYDIKD